MVDREERKAYWNDRYATEGAVFGAGPNQFVGEVLGPMPPGRVLDLGCGQGRNAIWLASRGHTVTGVDQSDVAVTQASEAAAAAGVEVNLVTADVVDWVPPEGAFDIVLLSYLQLEHERRVVAHAKAVTALAPGGLLLLVAHHPDNLTKGYGGPQVPEVLAGPDELARDFQVLAIERNEAVIRIVDRDGEIHEAIDVLLVARKRNAGAV